MVKEKVINTTCRTLVIYINFAKSKDQREKFNINTLKSHDKNN